MKAISLWQPYASLIAWGEKQYETRSWELPKSIKLPCQIAIHAAKNDTTMRDIYRITQIGIDSSSFNWANALVELFLKNGVKKWGDLPRGAIVATATLEDCIRMTPYIIVVQNEQERLVGDWSMGRYAWKLTNVKPLPEPIPAKGAQGLWNWKDGQS